MPTPPVDRTVAAIRRRVTAWRAAKETVALVPTMGALHAGHLALVREAGTRAHRIVVSIFVNPRQFSPTEDFAAYPRDEAADLGKLGEAGVDAVFAPIADEMYPPGFATTIALGPPATDLEAVSRSHFFGGVATVVAKLFHAALPDIAVFGEKDYQQLLVIRRMVADLAFPVTVIGLPTVREADGLALSSRNAYLTPDERMVAPELHAAMERAAENIRGRTPIPEALADATADLTGVGFVVDYLQVRNAETLAKVRDQAAEPLRMLAAVWLGKTRLIDNIAV